ncbi:anaerobic benzoate catabolism transcriptional regulator [compost metagenome]
MKRSTTEFDKDLGSRVRAVRTAIKMTQSELAQAVGLTFQQIQKYEQGTNRISASMLLQLSQALKADFSALVAPEGGRPADSVRSYEEARLLADFARLNADRQRLALELVKALGEV